MPIKDHPSFKPPQDDARMWRYMDLPRFVSLITTRSLWLSNMEILAGLDPYEGTLPQLNYQHRSWTSRHTIPDHILDALDAERLRNRVQSSLDEYIGTIKTQREDAIRRSFAMRKQYFLSCWHVAPHESAAMWQIYSHMQSGIAISTTVGAFKKTLASYSNPLFLGEVEYLDYSVAEVDTTNVLNVILAKRKSFEFEREVRLIFWDSDQNSEKILQAAASGGPQSVSRQRELGELEKMPVVPGITIPVELTTLIEGVWTAPTMPQWSSDAVQSISRWAGIGDKLQKSILLAPPLR